MTKYDVKNYLEKIYNVPVGVVRTRIQFGKSSHFFALKHRGPVTFSEFGVIVLFRKISSCHCQGWPYLFVFVVWDESVFAQL